MSIQIRNNVTTSGTGSATLLFAHGFGCDKNMWRNLVSAFESQYKVVTFDLVGSGNSDLSAYSTDKYASLHGYADDVLEIIEQCTEGPVIFVGHSVSATIGLLACNKAPEQFVANIMIGPSPRYINDGDYVGGFDQRDIEDLLTTMEGNYLGWSSTMAPAIMGSLEQPALGAELTNSFCRTDPEIAKHFARATFLSDHRADLYGSTTPTLILQCTDDIIAPQSVGTFMSNALPHSELVLIDNIGHCPHLSAPDATIAAMKNYLSSVQISIA
jgi:sigma-B regulation protein RsbQ